MLPCMNQQPWIIKEVIKHQKFRAILGYGGATTTPKKEDKALVTHFAAAHSLLPIDT